MGLFKKQASDFLQHWANPCHGAHSQGPEQAEEAESKGCERGQTTGTSNQNQELLWGDKFLEASLSHRTLWEGLQLLKLGLKRFSHSLTENVNFVVMLALCQIIKPHM